MIGSGLLAVLALWGTLHLSFSHYTLHWFPENHPLRQAVETIDRKMKGTMLLETIVDTQVENGLYAPDIMNKEWCFFFIDSR